MIQNRKKLTLGLYPVYSLGQACCRGSGAQKIGLKEPFSGEKISKRGRGDRAEGSSSDATTYLDGGLG
jgi:hypothetical protein